MSKKPRKRFPFLWLLFVVFFFSSKASMEKIHWINKGSVGMLDLWMVITLIVSFALVIGFIEWCGRSIEPMEGERE